jgi:hypothetical protein
MLKLYVDESGQEPNSEYCVVAGFIGYEENWVQFEEAWKAVIAPKQSLHMADLHWNSKPERIRNLVFVYRVSPRLQIPKTADR